MTTRAARRWRAYARLVGVAPARRLAPRIPTTSADVSGPPERPGLAVAGEEAPDPPVRVLDASLLPRTVRVQEIAPHRQLAGGPGVGGELAAAVEGDRAAGVLGQGPERLADARDHRRRALVLVRQQEGEAALPLDQGGHVGLAGRSCSSRG